MKYQIGDMLKFTPNASWNAKDIYCIVCDKGGKDELIVWWLTSSDDSSFMQSINVESGVYGVYRKVS